MLAETSALEPPSILDVGSLDVNGHYRNLFPSCEYTGLDIRRGRNVDVVVSDPYDWQELNGKQYDIIISGQCLEHVQYPWLTAEQMLKHLPQNGWLAIIAPSRQARHNHPSDYGRFFEQGIAALFMGRIKIIRWGEIKGKTIDDAWVLARKK